MATGARFLYKCIREIRNPRGRVAPRSRFDPHISDCTKMGEGSVLKGVMANASLSLYLTIETHNFSSPSVSLPQESHDYSLLCIPCLYVHVMTSLQIH